MEKKTGNENAFPLTIFEGTINENGLTKREYFAALAMQGYISSFSESYSGSPETTAKQAVNYADALIAELNKNPPQ